MKGFQHPNHTQAPNDLFEIMHDMKETELKVVLALIRLTFGYHRTRVRASITKLQEMTGLSRQGVINGGEAAEERGLVTKSNDGGVTIWHMIVNDIDQVVKNLDQTSQQNRPPSIKENNKEKEYKPDRKSALKRKQEQQEKRGDFVDGMLSQIPATQKQIRLEEIQSRLAVAFNFNCTWSRWERFIRFADKQEQDQGQTVEKFADWMKAKPGFDIGYWPPHKMLEVWPQAFTQAEPEEKIHYVRYDPEEEKQYVPMPEHLRPNIPK